MNHGWQRRVKGKVGQKGGSEDTGANSQDLFKKKEFALQGGLPLAP